MSRSHDNLGIIVPLVVGAFLFLIMTLWGLSEAHNTLNRIEKLLTTQTTTQPSKGAQ